MADVKWRTTSNSADNVTVGPVYAIGETAVTGARRVYEASVDTEIVSLSNAGAANLAGEGLNRSIRESVAVAIDAVVERVNLSNANPAISIGGPYDSVMARTSTGGAIDVVETEPANQAALNNDEIYVADDGSITEATNLNSQTILIAAVYSRELAKVSSVPANQAALNDDEFYVSDAGAITAAANLNGATIILSYTLELDISLDDVYDTTDSMVERVVTVTEIDSDFDFDSVDINDEGTVTIVNGANEVEYESSVVQAKTMSAAPVLPQSLIDQGAIQPADSYVLVLLLGTRVTL